MILTQSELKQEQSDMRFFRAFLIVCTILVGLLVWLTGSTNASAVTLRHNSVVDTQTIKLGDIFTGLPHSEDRVLGAAPRPGQDMVLNARTLMRIALALDLDWRPASSNDYVILRRAATIVDRETIEKSLRSGLENNGINGLYNLILSDDMAQIVLPENADSTVEIESLNINRDQKRFEATLVAPSKDNPLESMHITGLIERLVEVPVLRNAIRNGTVIGKRDIDIIQLPERHVQPDIILTTEELIGTTPRRMSYAGKPIKTSDVESPQIVGRGEIVTMIFKNGPLVLTAQGKSLENGAKGDIVRIVNTNSKRTIEAQVTGSKEVTLTSYQ